MHTQSPTTIIDTVVARLTTTPRTALRAGSTLLLGGLAFIADGITVGTDGFTGGVPNLAALAAFILFAVIATIAAWWRDSSDRPTEHQPAQDRLSCN